MTLFHLKRMWKKAVQNPMFKIAFFILIQDRKVAKDFSTFYIDSKILKNNKGYE